MHQNWTLLLLNAQASVSTSGDANHLQFLPQNRDVKFLKNAVKIYIGIYIGSQALIF